MYCITDIKNIGLYRRRGVCYMRSVKRVCSRILDIKNAPSQTERGRFIFLTRELRALLSYFLLTKSR